MAVTADRTVLINYAGDVVGTQPLVDATNKASSGVIQDLTLAIGFNSIAVPAGGATNQSVSIVPPVGNTTAITLKGITGDTGVPLHPTATTSIGLAAGTTAIGLTAAAQIVGVRLFWT